MTQTIDHRLPQLDERLRTAVELVPPCEVCADIGCDHGRFGTVLLAENRAQCLLAADVSAKALEKARARLNYLGFGERVTFAVADGLDALDALPDGRADVICVLGMGGDTVAGILQRGCERLHGATLVLGSQSLQETVRDAVQRIGYRLREERIAHADGRMYLLMRATPALSDEPAYTEKERLLGPCLLQSMPSEWRPWLERKRRLLSAAVAAMESADLPKDAQRLALHKRELQYTEETLRGL